MVEANVTMRELAIEAMAMRNRGSEPSEIRLFVYKGVNALVLQDRTPMTEHDNPPDGWEMRRPATGEVITYGPNGYSYRPN
ncbi:hypothetical protein TSA1_29715 [Bradyrhizobium nitroreducens]|uniref:Uncharacterized protein n=1 Tax=Bradyrhizobium nitroreducens TaxID=709803 RepID=A0A2M6UIM7_9BRAD|nr:hypothetical protein TSA1_29715 [Bradyrhizobium nitroreducens]